MLCKEQWVWKKIKRKEKPETKTGHQRTTPGEDSKMIGNSYRSSKNMKKRKSLISNCSQRTMSMQSFYLTTPSGQIGTALNTIKLHSKLCLEMTGFLVK